MAFSANQTNLNNIISRNTLYMIPKNQRKYVWDEREWSELFEDIFMIEQKDDYAHFLGSFVFNNNVEKKTYEIIDGQQRLVTISIIFCAIIKGLLEINEDKIAKSFLNTFLKGSNNGEDYFKIERADGPFFLTDLINKLDSNFEIENLKKDFNTAYGKCDKYNEKFLKCFLFFINKIDEYIKSKKKSKKDCLIVLKERLSLCQGIEIVVDAESDGYRIFETLNARGIPLEQHELVKNFICSYMRSKDKQQKVTRIWGKISENLTNNNTEAFSLFLNHYCEHIFGKIKRYEEFRIIRDNTDKKHVEELLTRLSINSLFYKYILNPKVYEASEESNPSVVTALNYFKDLNIRQVRPLLLSIFEQHENKKISDASFKNMFIKLENFYFMYSTILKRTTNIIDNSILSLAKKISDSNEIITEEIIVKELGKYISEKDKIRNQFTMIGYSNKNKKFCNSSNKKVANYILRKFENFYDTENEFIPKISSIEHIANDSENIDYVSYIGNLLPMPVKANGRIKDKPFSQKVFYYKNLHSLSIEEFVKHHGGCTVWNETEIMNRGQKMAEVAFEYIWKF